MRSLVWSASALNTISIALDPVHADHYMRLDKYMWPGYDSIYAHKRIDKVRERILERRDLGARR